MREWFAFKKTQPTRANRKSKDKPSSSSAQSPSAKTPLNTRRTTARQALIIESSTSKVPEVEETPIANQVELLDLPIQDSFSSSRARSETVSASDSNLELFPSSPPSEAHEQLLGVQIPTSTRLDLDEYSTLSQIQTKLKDWSSSQQYSTTDEPTASFVSVDEVLIPYPNSEPVAKRVIPDSQSLNETTISNPLSTEASEGFRLPNEKIADTVQVSDGRIDHDIHSTQESPLKSKALSGLRDSPAQVASALADSPFKSDHQCESGTEVVDSLPQVADTAPKGNVVTQTTEASSLHPSGPRAPAFVSPAFASVLPPHDRPLHTREVETFQAPGETQDEEPSAQSPRALEQAGQPTQPIDCSLTDTGEISEQENVIQSTEQEALRSGLSHSVLRRIHSHLEGVANHSLVSIETPPRPQTPSVMSSLPDAPSVSSAASNLSYGEKRRLYYEARDREIAASVERQEQRRLSNVAARQTPPDLSISRLSTPHSSRLDNWASGVPASDPVRRAAPAIAPPGMGIFSGLSGLQYPSSLSKPASPRIPFSGSPEGNASVHSEGALEMLRRFNERPASMPRIPLPPRRISSIGSMGAVVAGDRPSQSQQQAPPPAPPSQQQQQHLGVMQDVPKLDPTVGMRLEPAQESPTSDNFEQPKTEYFVPLELNKSVHEIYLRVFEDHAKLINDCLVQDEPWTLHQYQKLQDVFDKLRAAASHSDLLSDDTWTQQVSSREQAGWDANISSKFALLKALFDQPFTSTKHITLFVRPGRLTDMVERFFEGMDVNYTRPDRDTDNTTSSRQVRFTLIPTGDTEITTSLERSDLVLGFDDTFQLVHANVILARSAGRAGAERSPVICTVIAYSIEHVLRSMGVAIDAKPIKPLLQKLYQTRINAGRLPRTYLSPVSLGQAVAKCLENVATDGETDWKFASIDDLQILDFATSKSHRSTRKRRRDIEDSDVHDSVDEQPEASRILRKRRREQHNDNVATKDEPTTITINSSTPVSRIVNSVASTGSQTVPVLSEDAILLEAARTREAALLAEVESFKSELGMKEMALQSAYRIAEEHQTALAALQYRSEDQLTELHILRKQKIDNEALITANSLQKIRAADILANMKADREAVRTELSAARELLASSSRPDLVELEALRKEAARATKLEQQLVQQRADAEYIRSEYHRASAAAAEHAATITTLQTQISLLEPRARGEAVRLREAYASRHLELAQSRVRRAEQERRGAEQVISNLRAELERRKGESAALREQQQTRVGMALSTRSSSMPPKTASTLTSAAGKAMGVATRSGSRPRSRAGSRQASPMAGAGAKAGGSAPFQASQLRMQSRRSEGGEEDGETAEE